VIPGAKRVVVIGGGLAGITAALECAEAGAEVTLLESRGRLGGATFSIQRDGLWLDNGQHVFLRCCTAYRGLLARLGMNSSVVLQDRLSIPVLHPDGRSATLRRNRLPAPLHLAGAICRYRFLGPKERLGVLAAARALARLDLADPSLDERTFAEWLSDRSQSPAAVAALWDLITVPTVNLPAAEASLALAAKVFQTGLLEEAAAADVGYAAAPLQQLHGDAAMRALAAAGASVRLGARVRRVEPIGETLDVSWDDGDAAADVVVLAVPHDDAAELLPYGAEPAGAALRGLGSSPIVNVHVVYDRRVMDLPFAAGLGTPVQWVFDRTESSGLARGQYVAVSVSAATRYASWRLEQLEAEFVPALERLFPAARGARVERFFVTRERRATFRGVPGTQALRPGPCTSVSGLYLAGAWTSTGWPATMEGAVRSGLAAARAALAGASRSAAPAEVAA
jgi:squalene-associated FAD-dependent desaturase